MSFSDCLNCEQEEKICWNMLLTMAEFLTKDEVNVGKRIQQEMRFLDDNSR